MDGPCLNDLIDRARRGDPEAARCLLERYESAIRREVRFSLMDNQLRRVLDETDVCQSVLGQFFIGLWANRFEFQGPEQLIGLLKQMVRNKIIDRARYWKAGRRDFQRNVSRVDPEDAADPAAPGPSPSRIVADAELLGEFERRLSEQERTILSLRRQGVPWADVAERIGDIGPEALRKRFERSLDRVSRELGLDE